MTFPSDFTWLLAAAWVVYRYGPPHPSPTGFHHYCHYLFLLGVVCGELVFSPWQWLAGEGTVFHSWQASQKQFWHLLSSWLDLPFHLMLSVQKKLRYRVWNAPLTTHLKKMFSLMHHALTFLQRVHQWVFKSRGLNYFFSHTTVSCGKSTIKASTLYHHLQPTDYWSKL